MHDDVSTFLSRQHPYDQLPPDALEDFAQQVRWLDMAAGTQIYAHGDALPGLYVIASGRVSVTDPNGAQISILETGNSFGERGLLKDGHAATSARAEADTRLALIPAALFTRAMDQHAAIRTFFTRTRNAETHDSARRADLGTVRLRDLMVADPATCAPDTTVLDAARQIRDRRISCLCVVDGGRLVGIVTIRDLSGKALAEGMPADTPVSAVMTPDPKVLSPGALGLDVLHLMMEHRLGHLPVVDGGRLVGIVTQTDLTRYQATSAASLIRDAARAETADELPRVSARIPDLLAQLVGAGHRHDVVTRLVTDVADVITRRLLHLAEAELGPAPARYLWLACGSQGRQEQTGVSDQDNCLILEDGLDASAEAYFERLAGFVCDGLNACGYVHCPGDMMATNPRWRQPRATWAGYFAQWIASPGKEAQMLASVMFDLRPIGGDETLFHGLQQDTLAMAAKNSIFTAHMAQNALTHGTPLGLLRGFATIRSGEHRNTIDLKLGGVVPVVDLGRMYALQGRLTEVNTRARIEAAIGAGVVSKAGGRDLLDAYDHVANTRLEHQARLIRDGQPPDNFLPPARLSDFERSHLRDAFVVIRTMQSALMQGRGLLG